MDGTAGEALQTQSPETPKRPPTKRKFLFQIGTLVFEKRCSVADMIDATFETPGVQVSIVVDGASFKYIG